MSQILVDHISTVTEPWLLPLAGFTQERMRTPYLVLFLNLRSSEGQATVASRPIG